MKRLFFLLYFIFFAIQIFAQQQNAAPVFSQYATKEGRALMYKQMVEETISENLSDKIEDSTEGQWMQAFWAMETLLYHSDFCKQKLSEPWPHIDERSENFQKNLVEVCYTNYPTQFTQEIKRLLYIAKTPAVFVRCAEYLMKADPSADTKSLIQLLLKTKFQNVNDPALTILKNRMSSADQAKKLPPLNELFGRTFFRNRTVIYSLQRKNRDYPGLVVIRKPDGSFVRNDDGSVFHVPQLARSITNYPFYITNGNTPQGILRWNGFAVSRIGQIGPTPNLQMWLPYEAKPALFFGNDTISDNTPWNKNMYAVLLPDSWRNYEDIYESFYAGSLGRSAIIMHGTTIDPEYYKGQPYYPQTPSLGCLCTYEEWNEEGMRVKSNQQEIVDALDTTGTDSGYVVVIELNDANKPVSFDEIAGIISSAENAPNP